jgi:hypothetical protein
MADAEIPSLTTRRARIRWIACSGGRTGTVLTPVYGLSDTEVVLRTDVGVLPATGAHSCPGSDGVPITVLLPEAIGDRALVDWVCRQQSAASTSVCFDHGIRRAA